jgi:hypothetical protein
MSVASAKTVEKGRISEADGYGRMEMEPGRDAWELVRQVWMTDGPGEIILPVDPIAISRELGIKVLDDDDLAPDVPGVLRKQAGFRDPEILLNPLDVRARRRFTCAHALGHYNRNAEMRRDGQWKFVEGRDFFAVPLSDAEETYATEFAAELLMPRAVLRELDAESSTVASLGRLFGVTADVMGFRLDQVGWRTR